MLIHRILQSGEHRVGWVMRQCIHGDVLIREWDVTVWLMLAQGKRLYLLVKQISLLVSRNYPYSTNTHFFPYKYTYM